MTHLAPSSCGITAPTVFVGTNRRGNWIACEQYGTFGGLFVNRAQAFKYALRENGHHSETIVELSREIELDIPAGRRSPDGNAFHAIEEGQAVELCSASHEEQIVTP